MNLIKEKTSIPCPACRKDIEITYNDIVLKREAKCRKCSSHYKFKSSDASNLRSKIRDFEKAQEQFGQAFQKIIKNADIVLKK